jgi:hypothetical protein
MCAVRGNMTGMDDCKKCTRTHTHSSPVQSSEYRQAVSWQRFCRFRPGTCLPACRQAGRQAGLAPTQCQCVCLCALCPRPPQPATTAQRAAGANQCGFHAPSRNASRSIKIPLSRRPIFSLTRALPVFTQSSSENPPKPPRAL